MSFRDLVYKFIAQNPKGKVELVADPHSFYGSDRVEASYTLKLHKFKLDSAFVYRLEFSGKSESEVFEEAYKFILSRESK